MSGDPRRRTFGRMTASLGAFVPLCTALAVGTAAGQTPLASEGYVGEEVCVACHEEQLQHFRETAHAKVLNERNGRTEKMKRGCEACHGPGQAHVEAGGGRGEGGPGFMAFGPVEGGGANAQNAVCLGCHKGSSHLYWEGSPHQSRGAACTSCHTVMRKLSEHALLARENEVETCGQCHLLRRSQTNRNAHMPLRQGALPEGWMSCTSCHDPHGTVTPSLIAATSVNDGCTSCHADKRGPFLWEHAPVTENCVNCHDPHGSVTANMLKLPMPRLCQSCHVASRHPSTPYPPTDRRVFARGCLNCHTNIHGSNHPSGSAFTR